ncbi:MAG: DUF402 domain-containing protein [Haloferacaceae archaeon]
MKVRIRGVYATALTRSFLAAGHDVVGPSAPIRERFGDGGPDAGGTDAADPFGSGPPDVRIDTTADRQGVLAAGAADPVAAATDRLRAAGIDALSWRADAPPGAVFDARVTGTRSGGAVCDLGPAEGFLPFDAADGYVEVGDERRVQVASASPPWTDRRPELHEGVRVRAGPATLVRGGEGRTVAGRGDDARELARLLEVVGIDPPDGWGLRLDRSAADAGIEAVERAVGRAADRAAALGPDLDDPVGDPGPVARPRAGRFAWFGRETRFALDDRRRAVVPTMPGHHRIKAASGAAAAGVDLAEAVCGDALGDDPGDFPFGAVTRQFGPAVGDRVAIEHGKPAGHAITLGRGEVVERDPDGTLAVEREMTSGGSYDALGVPREAGDTALTKVREGRWWYPTVYRDADGDPKGTYVNVCTPVECFPDAVRYVDLHVDVVRHPDGRVERVDDDELDDAVADGDVPGALAERAREVAASIETAL